MEHGDSLPDLKRAGRLHYSTTSRIVNVREFEHAHHKILYLWITKEVSLIGTFNGVTKDPWGNTRAGFTAEGTLNRKDFGMIWNKALDNGGPVVGDEVQVRLDIECIKAKKS